MALAIESLFLLACAAAAAGAQLAPLPPVRHRVAVIAHRAGSSIAPENTLAALREAIRLGVDYVELDVRATRDGRLVIMHDSTVDRTTNGKGAVADMDFADIRSLDAGSKFGPRYAGEKVPTLDEALGLCRRSGMNLYLDHKSGPVARVLSAVRKHDMLRRVVVYNGVGELKDWKRLAPDVPVMPSLPDEYRRPGGIAGFERVLPAEVLNGGLDEWTPELVRDAHAARVKVYVDALSDSDTDESYRRAIAMGVDGIQTDHPDRLLAVINEPRRRGRDPVKRRGLAFIGISDFAGFRRVPEGDSGAVALTSPILETGIAANQVIVSWNAGCPAGAGLEVEAQAFCEGAGGAPTRYYTLGLWSPDGARYPRESVAGQKDADGEVRTDTLVLARPAQAVRLRVALEPAAGGAFPDLGFLGVSLADSHARAGRRGPDRSVLGRELSVPGLSQLGWPKADGWCSPTSTAMALDYWAERLRRREMAVSVPDAVAAVYDSVFKGTGNWPFNTAFAGSFPGMRAYVTRFADLREIGEWIAAGIPVIASASYDVLRDIHRPNDPGHLVVVTGFTGTGDVVVNDPATRLDLGQEVRHVYPAANFIRAWRRSMNTVYLVYPVGTKTPPDPHGHWDSGRGLAGPQDEINPRPT